MPAFHSRSHQDRSPSFSSHHVLERAQSQFLFSPEELLRSPSILEGMSVAQELSNRQKGVNFITQVGIMLKLPQLTLCTASVYLHRFFMRHAMAQPNKPGLHHYSVAATALFLATKVEENYRKMRELVVACCRVAQKQPNLVVDEQSKEYWKWRDTILHNEDLLLESLCFDLQLEQPYRILLDFLRYYGVQEKKPLRNTSWAFLNDSLITTLCLQMSPRVIAGSALYMGVKLAGITLPDDEQGRAWWEQLDLEIADIQKGCNLLAEVYENPNIPRQGQKEAYTRDDDVSLFEKTRQEMTPQTDRSPAISVGSGSQGRKRERDNAEDQEGWGSGPVSRPPGTSPKRQRRGSGEDSDGTRTSDHPSIRRSVDGSGQPAKEYDATADEVQRRIDAIVNASAPSTRVPPTTLSRRPSNQRSHQGDDSHRNSSTRSDRNGLASTPNTDQQEHVAAQYRPDKVNNGQHEPTSEHGQSRSLPRVPPLPAPPESRGAFHRQSSSGSAGEEIDDAEKVDYGSEEGEL
ncbi:hypothetical protein PV10_02612 [Exophiala mesophila]|uniref:RNA polymerase II holoenzyme cyclin-like subunit n=1 Tax=Exophiala mesophila TaxID=212818 RepID=A0A0D1Y2S5_EXOME|nr:uncharacterized protein PV10_02612 [Exophiala mesophila]KIV94891.1 hypothetical protein PV10_02612 [Exophiala mesophila]